MNPSSGAAADRGMTHGRYPPRSLLIALTVATLIHALLILVIRVELPRAGQPGRKSIAMTLVRPAPPAETPPEETNHSVAAVATPPATQPSVPAPTPPVPASPPNRPPATVTSAPTDGKAKPAPATGQPAGQAAEAFVGPPQPKAGHAFVGPPAPKPRLPREARNKPATSQDHSATPEPAASPEPKPPASATTASRQVVESSTPGPARPAPAAGTPAPGSPDSWLPQARRPKPARPPQSDRQPVAPAEPARTPAAQPQPSSPPPAAAKEGRPAQANPDGPPPRRGQSAGGAAPARRLDFSAGLLSQQIAEVSADLTRQRNAELLGKNIVYASAVKSHRLVVAAYEEAWREKVERIGNLNYPDEARRDKLSGRLLLAVGIKPDGSVYSIQVQHSSGHATLDNAARRIVELAAPFAPLPAELRDELDILVITRTWRFDSDYRLETR